MHYHKKKLIGRGMNESGQILTHTIDYQPFSQLYACYALHYLNHIRIKLQPGKLHRDPKLLVKEDAW